ncbi:MAG TPA: TOMM precursor leader peptide-binding protein [Candidatus Bathyarchaeia archaeon]|nr:TOMM precursor leader peptide-binding protein [Candidatus Bathyarchaeia archaeon]
MIELKNEANPLAVRPVLPPGVKMTAVNEEFGYVDCPDGLFRVKSPLFSRFVTHVLPLLDGQRTIEQIAQEAANQMNLATLQEILHSFRAKGFVQEKTEEPDSSVTSALLITRQKLSLHFQAIFQSFQMPVTVIDADDLENDWRGRLADHQGLVVAVSDRVHDPLPYEINRACVAKGLPVLFAGLEKRGEGYVGPYWEPGDMLPCYDCFQLRLSMNDPQGKLRHEYAQFIQETQELPAESLVSWQLLGEWANRVVTETIRYTQDTSASSVLKGKVVWLSNEEKVVAEEHDLLPVPRCPACYARQKAEMEHREYPNNLMQAVNPRVGLLRDIFSVQMGEKEPRIFSYGSTTTDNSLINSPMPIMRHSGAGYAEQDAIYAAIGESIERYAASMYDEDRLVLSTWAELQKEAVHPESFALFSAEQYAQSGFPYQRFTEQTPLRWVQGYAYPDKRPVWLPASLVYLPYKSVKGETRIVPSISTGLAAGPSLQAAILGGLYEVIERDAVSISWLNKLPPRELPSDLIASYSRWDHVFPTDSGITFTLYDMTLDVPVPTILAFAHRPGEDRTLIHVGGSCRRNPLAAIDKALLECAQSFPYIPQLLSYYKDWEPGPAFENVDTFQKHAVLYSMYPELQKQGGYLVHPQAETLFPFRPVSAASTLSVAQALASTSVEEDLNEVVRLLKEKDLDVYVVDLTTPDLKKIGAHVVRVIVPGMLHLSGSFKYRLLGGKRITEVPKALGFSTSPTNPYPHPYP